MRELVKIKGTKDGSLIPGIIFEDSHHSDECNTTTYYFIAPKELLGQKNPEAEHAEISIEIQDDAPDATYATAQLAASKDGEDYDWYEVTIPYCEVISLLTLANANLFPDPSVTIEEMHRFGYDWEGMYPLNSKKAMELFDAGCEIYALYPDNTEAAMDDVETMQKMSEDLFFGIEKNEWVRRKDALLQTK